MGDCLGHYRKHLSGQTAIAFCCSVAHAEAVAHLFQSAGIAAASIDGTMDAGTRRDLLQRLAVGDLKVLTSCALIGEGVDVPSVGGCILLRPTASVALHLQMIGRCLRPQPGKRAVVLDHVGNTLRLGHHLEPREWSLDGLKKRDRDAAPSVRVCSQCFATSVSTAQVCRECGHVFAPPERRELRQVDGELVEYSTFKPGDLVLHKPTGAGWFFGALHPMQYNDQEKRCNLFKRKDHSIRAEFSYNEAMHIYDEGLILTCSVAEIAKPSRKREQGKATDLEALRELAQQRGYKRGWAERVYQARLLKRHGG
jgi:superfamily II DNA or RNA helicase